MGNVFSRKPKVTDTDRAILALKTQRRKLSAQQKQLDAVIEREKEVARELLQQKKKDRALLTLRRKKAQEELLKKVEVWLVNVEQQLLDIDTAGRQKALFDSLKAGNKAIQDLQKEVNVEDIQKLMEDSVEAQAYQDEINKALGQQLTDEDNEAVLTEFENLELEMGLEDLPNVPDAGISPPEPDQPEKVPAGEDTVADGSDGLMALRSKKATAAGLTENDGGEISSKVKRNVPGVTKFDGDVDELKLPNVPTSRVSMPKKGGVESNSSPASRRAEEPLPA